MNKKKKKTETCIDCEGKTNDFYPVFSNRGTVFRCSECFELWLTRSTRYHSHANNTTGKVTGNRSDNDPNAPRGVSDWD